MVCANAVHQASQLAHLARPVLEVDRHSPAYAWDKVRRERDRDGEEEVRDGVSWGAIEEKRDCKLAKAKADDKNQEAVELTRTQ